MSNITINHLTFTYPGEGPLFDDVNLIIDDQWRLGLLGRNGRGKTTLLKLIQGQLHGSGKITAHQAFVSYPLNILSPSLPSIMAIQEVVPIEEWQVAKELSKLNAQTDILWQPYNTLSGGEQTKAQLACAFADPTSFVLLDEPTNHLDAITRQTVIQYLQDKKQGFIITSHDRNFLDQVIDHVLVIEAKQLYLQQGNYSNYRAQKDLRDQSNQARNDQLKKEIHRLKATVQEKQTWANKAETKKDHATHSDRGFLGAKAARMMKRSISLKQRLNNEIKTKEGLLENIEQAPELTMNHQPALTRQVLAVHNLSLGNEDQPPLFKPLTFNLECNQQLIITGANGTGKTTLLNYLAKQITTHSSNSSCEFPGQLTVSYLHQQLHFSHQELDDYAQSHGLEKEALLNLLYKLGFQRNEFRHATDELSAGQQRKLALATCLLTPANLYLLDEPFNYLDTYNQDQLITLLRTVQPSLIMVEHDPAIIHQLGFPTIDLEAES